MRSAFPIPFINLLLISRQVHDEVRDFLYSSVPFTVDVRKDGTFMCGRRLLEPRRADGSSHYIVGDVDKIKEKFLKTFDWAAVKNYNVDILVENWKDDTNRGYHTFPWDEEVEIYDIRDYIGVVISGILSKARNLCRLNVRLGFSKFIWTQEELYTNIKTLVGPFERLRNVRQPRFVGVYEGTPQTNFMISLPVPGHSANFPTLFNVVNGSPHGRPSTPLCSVPQLPTKVPLFICNEPEFVEYRSEWERWIASESVTSLVLKPPIRAMFTELKEFYTRLAATVPDVTARNGRHAFLHRARVAREQENVEAFRHLRNELIGYWEAYLEQEERKKDDMNRRLSRMLDVDVYPASWDEDHACIAGSNPGVARSSPGSSSQSPVITDADLWLNGVNCAQRDTVSSVACAQPMSIVPHDQSQSQAGSSKSEGIPDAQVPAGIDLADEDQSIHETQEMEDMRLRDVIPKPPRQIQQRHRLSLRSPTFSDDQKSPSMSTLQSSKDQQPMALNPQLYLEAAMSHRRQAELQAHRARAMQQVAQRQAMAHRTHIAVMAHRTHMAAILAGGQVQAQLRQNPAFSSTLSRLQSVSMPTMPMQQMQSQLHASASSSASSSISPVDGISPATRGIPVEMRYHQQQSSSSYLGHPGYSFDQNVTIPNAEPAVHVYEGPSHKRVAPETEEAEMAASKRQRVDSGMGWADEGYGTQRDTHEDGAEATAVEERVHRAQNCELNEQWEFGGQATVGGKGKGKARVEQPATGWVDQK
jgi:hypothetical protein